jgi:xylan 1,4-beta-xylosidase
MNVLSFKSKSRQLTSSRFSLRKPSILRMSLRSLPSMGLIAAFAMASGFPAPAQDSVRKLSATLNLNDSAGPMEIERFSLAQGGQSDEPIWASRTAEIRGLRVKTIRVFVVELFDLLPEHDKYNFAKLDQFVDMVRQSGAEPLMDLTFKPKLLYPKIDPKVMYPNSWGAWNKLLYNLVKHYKDRNAGIKYWEVGDECEIGEGSGVPYECTPENFAVYYQHTVEAIRQADPDAKVGGPTAANAHTPVLTYLVSYADEHHVQLDFVSWHVYSNDPQRFRETMEYVKSVLAKHPSIHPETFLDEWNEDLDTPPLDPRFQPCFIAEIAYQMKEADIDFMGYYQIRDYQLEADRFAKFMTPRGTASLDRAWNRAVQADGLFDYQDQIRPSYFAFKLLSRLTGERIRFETNDKNVHGLAAWDSKLGLYNVLLWNFSKTPVQLNLAIDGATTPFKLSPRVLDATAASNDENVRMTPIPSTQLKLENMHVNVDLGVYGVELLTFSKNNSYLNY